eukprot:3231206-Pyramimonas_sp.AAC.2
MGPAPPASGSSLSRASPSRVSIIECPPWARATRAMAELKIQSTSASSLFLRPIKRREHVRGALP